MKRDRLTITLDSQVLKRVDSFIDGKKIRNRSHAIEYLVKSNLPLTVRQAVILAGGPGVNFRPLTYEIPNVLIPFKGKPLLTHLINQIKQAGINEIVICVGHLSEKIVKQFKDGQDFGVSLNYSFDGPRPLGTAGAILKAKKYLKNGPFLVIHGDVMSNIDLQAMIDFHNGDKYLATLALTTIQDPRRHGIVRAKGIDLMEFDEKPSKPRQDSNLINAGIYILEEVAFKYFPKKRPAMMEKDVFPKLVKAKKAAAYLFEGSWFDISYPEHYEQALKKFERKGVN
ncbi:sugar phosphate nucleotidyltransferase [Patescibacteria group bacterium]